MKKSICLSLLLFVFAGKVSAATQLITEPKDVSEYLEANCKRSHLAPSAPLILRPAVLSKIAVGFVIERLEITDGKVTAMGRLNNTDTKVDLGYCI